MVLRKISSKIFKQNGGSYPTIGIQTVKLKYSVNKGAWQELSLAGPAADSTYTAEIPKQTAGSSVRYFMKLLILSTEPYDMPTLQS